MVWNPASPQSPQTPLTIGRFPVPHMVVGSYDEACIHKFGNHVQISSGMLAESVDNLYQPFRPGSRDINPSLYLVTFVVRRKAYLMQHK